MLDWAGSRTPKAPRSGARGCRFCRARSKIGARAHSARQNWGAPRLLELARAGMNDRKSGEMPSKLEGEGRSDR